MNIWRLSNKQYSIMKHESLILIKVMNVIEILIPEPYLKLGQKMSSSTPFHLMNFQFANRKYGFWVFKKEFFIAKESVKISNFARYGKITINPNGHDWWLKFFNEQEKLERSVYDGLESSVYSEFSNEEFPTKDNRYIPQSVKIQVVLRDNGRCVYCGELNPDMLEFDHIKAWSRGGSSKDIGNICLGCKPCNRKKGAKDWWLA